MLRIKALRLRWLAMPKIIDTPQIKRDRLEAALATICVEAGKHMDYQDGVDRFFKDYEWVLECKQ
jgi:hypothetical protein